MLLWKPLSFLPSSFEIFPYSLLSSMLLSSFHSLFRIWSEIEKLKKCVQVYWRSKIWYHLAFIFYFNSLNWICISRQLLFKQKRYSLDTNIFQIVPNFKDILREWDHRNFEECMNACIRGEKIGSDRQFKMNRIESLHQMAFGKWDDINLF